MLQRCASGCTGTCKSREARTDQEEGFSGCQAEARGVIRGVLQLAQALCTCKRMCWLAAEQVRLREQAQHLRSKVASLLTLNTMQCTRSDRLCKGQDLPDSFQEILGSYKDVTENTALGTSLMLSVVIGKPCIARVVFVQPERFQSKRVPGQHAKRLTWA